MGMKKYAIFRTGTPPSDISSSHAQENSSFGGIYAIAGEKVSIFYVLINREWTILDNEMGITS